LYPLLLCSGEAVAEDAEAEADDVALLEQQQVVVVELDLGKGRFRQSDLGRVLHNFNTAGKLRENLSFLGKIAPKIDKVKPRDNLWPLNYLTPYFGT
jgi:hypothetical protein